MSHLLSKSKYIRGLQCDRALWLDVFNPRLARYTAEQMRRFDRGRDFEFAFKATFPDGIDLSAELKRNVDAYPARTAELLDRIHTPSPLRGTPPNLGGELKGVAAVGEHYLGSSPKLGEGDRREAEVEECETITLFEAGFLYDDVLVLADVVQLREDGTLDIYEVKSGTALSETYRRDAALQHYVISHCREVHSFSIVHAGNAGVPPATGYADVPSAEANAGETPAHPGFAIVDLTAELATQHDEIARNITTMKEILRRGEPATPTGQHCLDPYACPYQHYCAQGVRQMSLFG